LPRLANQNVSKRYLIDVDSEVREVQVIDPTFEPLKQTLHGQEREVLIVVKPVRARKPIRVGDRVSLTVFVVRLQQVRVCSVKHLLIRRKLGVPELIVIPVRLNHD
jgi:hypothetical protein